MSGHTTYLRAGTDADMVVTTDQRQAHMHHLGTCTPSVSAGFYVERQACPNATMWTNSMKVYQSLASRCD